jgi:hypothetical protein
MNPFHTPTAFFLKIVLNRPSITNVTAAFKAPDDLPLPDFNKIGQSVQYLKIA